MERKFKIGDSKVLESRETVDGTMIRRRRETTDGHRFTTYERIEMPSLTVSKRSGNKEIFDRDKLLLAVKRSVGKFFNSELEIEDVVNKASDILYSYSTDEITSKQIGEAVLDVLANVNEVAYVRFASVFREFKTLEDFEDILREQRDKHRRVAPSEGGPRDVFAGEETATGPARRKV
ncbi:transcriptional repressor NrdR [Candidatus Saccharibacteria bacterium]|nr:transcriptional repressor NrdR [Candidatus Saccharibacteria bacterium]